MDHHPVSARGSGEPPGYTLQKHLPETLNNTRAVWPQTCWAPDPVRPRACPRYTNDQWGPNGVANKCVVVTFPAGFQG